MSARALSRDMLLGNVTEDPFENGDVIRWVTHSGYTYAAIKTPVGWATTARDHNMYVRPMYRYLDLVKMLSKKDVDSIETSARWNEVTR